MNEDRVVAKAECENFIPEENNEYPLCINKGCEHSSKCNISAHMDEEPYWSK